MSQENVEIVQQAFAAWNAGDMEAFRECYHPDVVMRPLKDWPEPGPWVGREAVMRQFKQMRDTYHADTQEPITEYRHIANHVVVRGIWHTIGQGPESKLESTILSTFRERRIRDQEFFWDHAEALRAVGLPE